ncbi:MAG: sulfotransferase family 2 domain-containing protein [Anaerolineae bacterium]|nr:sulfotransferase family 2 domain-containing protein [Anaerolineae bacterium]
MDQSTQDCLFFIHIPKTAGTSVIDFLDRHYSADEIAPAMLPEQLVLIPQGEIEKYRLLRGHFGYKYRMLLPKNTKTITILRDPIERIISYYYYLRRESARLPRNRVPEHVRVATSLSLEEFASSKELYFLTSNCQVSTLISTPRQNIDVYSHSQIVDLITTRLSELFFVGFTEILESSVETLCTLLGWCNDVSVQHLNTNQDHPSAKDLPSQVRQTIQDRNIYDYYLYNLAKSMFPTSVKAEATPDRNP